MSYVRFSPPLAVDLTDSPQNISNVTGCPDGVQWIYNVIGDCDVTPRQIASSYVGMASILAWMMVSLPQIYKNFRNIDGMAGVSFFLIFQWTGGDTTNLIGSLLTHQLKFQIYLAIYFVFTDVLLLLEYMWYFIRTRRMSKQESQSTVQNTGPQLILCLMGLFGISHTIFSISGELGSSQMSSTQPRYLSRSLLQIESQEDLVSNSGSTNFWHDTTDLVGYGIGIVSSIFYLGSRTAQIIKNYQKKSTEGLAITTFILAVVGNIAYGGQILVLSLEKEFILEKFPWLVGSLGVIGLDCTLLWQFRHYRNYEEDEERKHLLSGEQSIVVDDNSIPVEIPHQSELRYPGDNIA